MSRLHRVLSVAVDGFLMVAVGALLGLVMGTAAARRWGTEAHACYGNRTCNDGLACLSGVCVKASSTPEGGN